jgi:osmotically inducible protein OsmC
MSVRKATAVWKGSLKEGTGSISTASQVLNDVAYDFGKRFADDPGTNPEELIAAAHAACFSMATAGELGKAGLTPESLSTRAEVTLDRTATGPTVTEIRLVLEAKIPGADEAAFRKAAETAKANCPISRLLNAKIELDAKLV